MPTRGADLLAFCERWPQYAASTGPCANIWVHPAALDETLSAPAVLVARQDKKVIVAPNLVAAEDVVALLAGCGALYRGGAVDAMLVDARQQWVLHDAGQPPRRRAGGRSRWRDEVLHAARTLVHDLDVLRGRARRMTVLTRREIAQVLNVAESTLRRDDLRDDKPQHPALATALGRAMVDLLTLAVDDGLVEARAARWLKPALGAWSQHNALDAELTHRVIDSMALFVLGRPLVPSNLVPHAANLTRPLPLAHF